MCVLLVEREGKLVECSRLDFSRRFLQGILGLAAGDINCLCVAAGKVLRLEP